jgi:catechol 2,3-dioxygenase-like lactoylglutathione lyase family enzyme
MRIHHLALRVADCEASLAFYSHLLGLREVRRTVEHGRVRSIWLEAGSTMLMLELGLRGEGGASGSGHLLAFAVESLAEWEERLAGAGIPVLDRTPHTLYVRDPDGHRVGLSVYSNP